MIAVWWTGLVMPVWGKSPGLLVAWCNFSSRQKLTGLVVAVWWGRFGESPINVARAGLTGPIW